MQLAWLGDRAVEGSSCSVLPTKSSVLSSSCENQQFDLHCWLHGQLLRDSRAASGWMLTFH